MTPARLSFYSTISILFCGVFWLALTVFIGRIFSPMSDGAVDAAMVLALLLTFVSSCFLITVLLKRSAAKDRIRLVDQQAIAYNFRRSYTRFYLRSFLEIRPNRHNYAGWGRIAKTRLW
jgi:hypothetical protein